MTPLSPSPEQNGPLTVCSECRCLWDLDDTEEPNRPLHFCDGCPCHRWEFVEERARERADDGLEAAWRAAGYADSYSVYVAEGR